MSTLSTDLYAPEVWADESQAAFEGNTILSNAALQDDTLVGQPGDTINFPKWNAMSEMEDIAESDVLAIEGLTQSNSSATIKEAGKAFGIKDKAKLTGIGNAQDEAIRQFGVLAARKIDRDLYSSALVTVADGVTYADGTAATASAPLSFSAGLDIDFTYDAIVDSLGLFGDDFDPSEFAGLYINSAHRAAALKSDDFQRAAQGNGSNAVINRGLIGDIAGLPVFVTNRVEAGKSLVVKRNSLGLLWKRRPLIEFDRDITARENVVAINMHYATKRLNDKGVLVINWKTA